MPDFHLAEVTEFTSWAGRADHALLQQVTIEIHGEDQAGSLESATAGFTDTPARIRGLVVALAGPAASDEVGRFGLPPIPPEPRDVLGSVNLVLPLRDNQHVLDAEFIQVAAAHRRRGIGSALVGALHGIADLFERDTILTWSDHRQADTGALITPVHGGAGVPDDGAARFAQHHGFTLAQVQRQSRLVLPVAPQLLDELTAAAQAMAEPAYHLVSWSGPTPPEYLDAAAQANTAISADAPTGDLQWEEEAWDADRVREYDQRLASAGTAFHTLALSAEGATAGLSTIFVENGPPLRGYQGNTVVLAQHRGHRLGMWLKTTNLAAVTAQLPELGWIDTWNADENQHMLAINTALGFQKWSVGGGWQLRRG